MITSLEAKLALPKRKIEQAKDIINQMLTLCAKPYIALSFGKDSLVMLDLIYQTNNQIDCLFLTSDETFLMHNFKEVIDWYEAEKGIKLKIITTNTLLKNDFNLDKAREERKQDWMLDVFFEYDGVFMGLRAEESKARRLSLMDKNNVSPGILQYKSGKRKGQYRACPLKNWTQADIEIYSIAHNLKMLNVYEKLGFGERTTARIPRAEHRASCLHSIKQTSPENFNKLIALIPDLRLYV